MEKKTLPGIIQERKVNMYIGGKQQALVSEFAASDVFALVDREITCVVPDNVNRYKESVLNRDKGFSGGSVEEFIEAGKGNFDTKAFQDAREKLNQQLADLDFGNILSARKRERAYSPYDGELDMDRRYDINPFASTQIANNGVQRIVNIKVDFSFSAGVEAEQINAYGAMAWAVVDLLETNGIQCDLSLIITTTGMNGVNPHQTKIVNIKKAGEYIETMAVARCFTSNFYRRGIFAAIIGLQDNEGVSTPYGLGYPKQQVSKASPGEIIIGASHALYPDLEQVANFIRTAVQGNKGEEK